MPETKLPSTGKNTKATKVDEMSRQLADDIVNGRLTPGYRLDEARLADRFKVSRTPVREALRQLEAMGLVEKRPHRGVVVRSVNESQLAQMFEAIAEMEATCARLSAIRMTTKERQALEKNHQEALPLVAAGDLVAYEKANLSFHTLIYQGTQNSVIVDICQSLRRRVSPFRRNTFHLLGRLSNSHREHEKIVAAIVQGDMEGAAEAMRQHIGVVNDASDTYLSQG